MPHLHRLTTLFFLASLSLPAAAEQLGSQMGDIFGGGPRPGHLQNAPPTYLQNAPPNYLQYNPAADRDRMREQQIRRIEQEAQRNLRQQSNRGIIDSRDYSKIPRPDAAPRKNAPWIGPDYSNHQRPARQQAPRTAPNKWIGQDDGPPRQPRTPRTRKTWVGPDYSNRDTAYPYKDKPAKSPRQPATIHPGSSRQNERYYGTRSGESLYPYTDKPVKGSIAADLEKSKKQQRRPENIPAAVLPAQPRDPSYGGNKAWNLPKKDRADTRLFLQDEIARYRKEHRQQAFCRDGSISGKSSGACSRHGGLLKRS